jgi:hypothetical protein
VVGSCKEGNDKPSVPSNAGMICLVSEEYSCLMEIGTLSVDPHFSSKCVLVFCIAHCRSSCTVS